MTTIERKTIEALRKRADTWVAEEGEIGGVVASEIRAVIRVFEAILGQPRIKERVQSIYDLAGWQSDDSADPGDQSPEDNVAHINGLIRQECLKILGEMDRQEDATTTLERLRKLITVELYHDAEDIVPEAVFQTDLMLEWEDVLTLVAECEGEFGINVDNDDYDELVTVGDLVALIDRLSGEK